MILHLAPVAVLSAFFSAVSGLGAQPQRGLRWQRLQFVLLGASGLAAVFAGVAALLRDSPWTHTLPLGLPWLRWHLRLDALSGFFFVLVGLLLVAVSLYGPGYVREFRRSKSPPSVLGFFTGLFVAGMLLVLLADDAFTFMIAWELMSVASYFLVTYQHQHEANRRAGFLYLLMAHIGALAILLGFGVLSIGGGFTFEAMRAAPPPPVWASVAFALALFGFGMKAGLVPIHAWLPEAHPVAPSHISALMSGVMLKVAVYGFIRFIFDLGGDVQWAWGLVVLVVGAASALLGVLYALMQNDLKRLLAYSSIENVGIVFVGLGLAMIFIGSGSPVLGVLGLVAALYHAFNHALFKGLLFLGAGALLHATHESDLNRLGGLIRRMPHTAAFFLVGCLAIAGLPPLNGFVSEWLTLQAALQAPGLQSGVLRSLIPVAAAILALAAALAAALFVKVFGVAFLGQARSRHAARAHEVRFGMRAAMALLAALCLLFGVFPTIVIHAVDAVPRLLLGQGMLHTDAGWLWLTPISPQVASYAAPLVVAAIGIVAFALYFLFGHRARTRRGDAWDCGFGSLNPRMEYTATSFAMPIRRIFRPAFDIREDVDERFHAAQPVQTESLRHQLRVQDRSWPRLYEPIARLVLAAARRVGVIQTGSIHTYLVYSFLTLLLLLWVVT